MNPAQRDAQRMTSNPALADASRMADVIVRNIRERGDCSTLDLELAGFTDAQIARHSRNAQALAAVTLNRPLAPLDRIITCN